VSSVPDILFGNRHSGFRSFVRSLATGVLPVAFLIAMFPHIDKMTTHLQFGVLSSRRLFYLLVALTPFINFVYLFLGRWFFERAAEIELSRARPDRFLVLQIALAVGLPAAIILGFLAGFIILMAVGRWLHFQELSDACEFVLAYGWAIPGTLYVWCCLILGWMWLYLLSVLVLTCVRRFDIGISWLTMQLDIEHHPLRAVGLVAGGIAALFYWAGRLLFVSVLKMG
jgi:hypothetical protein